MKKMVLSVLVENTAGVLNRVAGLFSRRRPRSPIWPCEAGCGCGISYTGDYAGAHALHSGSAILYRISAL